jgi:hypothetical protein
LPTASQGSDAIKYKSPAYIIPEDLPNVINTRTIAKVKKAPLLAAPDLVPGADRAGKSQKPSKGVSSDPSCYDIVLIEYCPSSSPPTPIGAESGLSISSSASSYSRSPPLTNTIADQIANNRGEDGELQAALVAGDTLTKNSNAIYDLNSKASTEINEMLGIGNEEEKVVSF